MATMNDRFVYIYGKHAVVEALRLRPEVVGTVFLRDDVQREVDPVLLEMVRKVRTFTGDNVPVGIDKNAVHQGCIAQIDRGKLISSYTQFMQQMIVTEDTCVAVLAEVQDPHNVGAVIRSAAAFGVQAVLLPKHRQAGITGTVIKVSSGMAFALPLVEVGNVNRTLEDLKKVGFFVYGLDGSGKTLLNAEQFTKPTVFVLGNEADGLRAKTKEHCDLLLRIPMHQRCESLNASASAATVFYQWSIQHPRALQ